MLCSIIHNFQSNEIPARFEVLKQVFMWVEVKCAIIHTAWLTFWNELCVVIVPKSAHLQPNGAVFILHVLYESLVLLSQLYSHLPLLFYVQNKIDLLVAFGLDVYVRIFVIIFIHAHCYYGHQALKLGGSQVKNSVITFLKSNCFLQLRGPQWGGLFIHAWILSFSPWVPDLTYFSPIYIIHPN